MNDDMRQNKIEGCLFGTAFGDALGASTEFMSVGAIEDRWPPAGPTRIEGDPARVTDDTQMMLAVGRAITDTPGMIEPETITPHLIRHFVAWLNDPQNNRAPGNTCLTACHNLEKGGAWQLATVKNSKGCGANMRVQPVGLIADGRFAMPSDRAGLAQLQAALTHGHATGLAAADLTAHTIYLLCNGIDPAVLLPTLITYAESQRTVYHQKWLGDVWQRPVVPDAITFIARGWDECLAILHRAAAALADYDSLRDPCEYTGDGWIAEEAFGTALVCFLGFVDAPLPMLNRAAVTRGDSDSIACIAGAFAGAYHGRDAFPTLWYTQIEYATPLQQIATGLVDK